MSSVTPVDTGKDDSVHFKSAVQPGGALKHAVVVRPALRPNQTCHSVALQFIQTTLRSGCKTPGYLHGISKAILFPSLAVATYEQFGATSMPEDLARVVRQPRQT
ncbi:hypothetical protein N7501_003213 [Penicillium viridicatum]|nr:hypothetical protein N7501_003213 [Penicillium viridicatum]